MVPSFVFVRNDSLNGKGLYVAGRCNGTVDVQSLLILVRESANDSTKDSRNDTGKNTSKKEEPFVSTGEEADDEGKQLKSLSSVSSSVLGDSDHDRVPRKEEGDSLNSICKLAIHLPNGNTLKKDFRFNDPVEKVFRTVDLFLMGNNEGENYRKEYSLRSAHPVFHITGLDRDKRLCEIKQLTNQHKLYVDHHRPSPCVNPQLDQSLGEESDIDE